MSNEPSTTPPPELDHSSLLDQSSPLKNVQHISGREQLEVSSTVREAPVHENFVQDHLSKLPDGLAWRNHVDKELLAKATERQPQGGEVTYYDPFARFLTKLSQHIYGELDSKQKENLIPIVFLPNGTLKMTHHPAGPVHDTRSNYPPDVIGVPGSLGMYERVKTRTNSSNKKKGPVYVPCPYPLTRTIVEMKTEYEDGIYQAISYTWYVFEASPHITGMYVIATKPQHYQLAWVDAMGPIISPRFDWSDLEPLVRYLFSLYLPPGNHHLVDSTITPHKPSAGNSVTTLLEVPESNYSVDSQRPLFTWNVDAIGKLFKECRLLVWSGGFGRRTTIFQKRFPDGKELIIKDTFRDEGRRFTEKGILTHIHKAGTVPGVVRLVGAEDVRASSETNQPLRSTGTVYRNGKEAHRVRTRLLLGSFGERLSRAKSVGDLLKAIYDTVEVHRVLVMERRILHRDMSANNILMYPQHHPDSQGDGFKFFTPQKPVRFIDDVLRPLEYSQSDTTIPWDRTRCLIIDFDNSSPADKTLVEQLYEGGAPDSNAVEHDLAERTGTPVFISRSVALGKTLTPATQSMMFLPMPELDEDAKNVYVKTYGQEAYDEWCDPAGHYHGGVLRDRKTITKIVVPFVHRPDHDVESVFWTLLHALVIAYPLGEPPEEDFDGYVGHFRREMFNHSIAKSIHGRISDQRGSFLRWLDDMFDVSLHPKLQNRGLGLLLQQLAEQVQPEYAFLEPNPRVDHLHEAFRRLLLEFIVEFENDPRGDIALDPKLERNIDSTSNPAAVPTVTSNPKKRPHAGDGIYRSSKRSLYSEVNGSRNLSEPRDSGRSGSAHNTPEPRG